MQNIHLIPTNKPSRLHLAYNKNYYLSVDAFIQIDTKNYKSFNLNITSDEYIGLSYYLDGNLIRKGVVDDKDYWEVRKDCKKIILTTDQDLIKDGVQSIDDEFLKWFIKDTSWEVVKVSKNWTYLGWKYVIIIPR